jgi:exosortase
MPLADPREGEARNLLGVGYPMPVTNAAILAPDSPRAQRATRSAAVGLIVVAAFLIVLWLEVIRHLHTEWSHNPQYNFGWSVPFLALYLLWKRWLERPTPEPSQKGAAWVIATAAILILPLRFLSEANPDWRLLSWTMTGAAVTASLAVVSAGGGRSWLRHFAFPILFFCVAVPWPMQFEQMVIQNLMRAVTAINVFFLSVAGVPALQHGNVIEVKSGLIGIEEACSGVRSLQATLMVSLFLGEFYSFSVLRRILLVVAGAILAFICNLVRTAVLVWVGAQHGAESIEAWHDPAGLTILLVCLFGLWGLSLLMSRGSEELTLPASSGLARPFPTLLLGVLIASLVTGELAVQWWYQSHQSGVAASRWQATWPNQESAYKQIVIPPATQSILRYDEGGGATWNGSDVHHWMMYFFRWLPGRTAALFVKIHRPDVCLPASGLTLNRDNGIQLVSVNAVKLPVRYYRFDDRGVPLHVLYCYWDARSSYESVAAANEEDWTAAGRIRAALRGRREVGAQMLELVVWGYQDDAEAKAALARELERIVRPG